SDEAVTASRERLDIARRLRRVPECPAELADHGIETGVEIHDTLGPQERDQLLARHDTPGVSDQLPQHQHRLLLQPHPLARALELPRLRVEYPPIEADFAAAHAKSESGQSYLRNRSAAVHGVAPAARQRCTPQRTPAHRALYRVRRAGTETQDTQR